MPPKILQNPANPDLWIIQATHQIVVRSDQQVRQRVAGGWRVLLPTPAAVCATMDRHGQAWVLLTSETGTVLYSDRAGLLEPVDATLPPGRARRAGEGFLVLGRRSITHWRPQATQLLPLPEDVAVCDALAVADGILLIAQTSDGPHVVIRVAADGRRTVGVPLGTPDAAAPCFLERGGTLAAYTTISGGSYVDLWGFVLDPAAWPAPRLVETRLVDRQVGSLGHGATLLTTPAGRLWSWLVDDHVRSFFEGGPSVAASGTDLVAWLASDSEGCFYASADEQSDEPRRPADVTAATSGSGEWQRRLYSMEERHAQELQRLRTDLAAQSRRLEALERRAAPMPPPLRGPVLGTRGQGNTPSGA